MGTKIFRFSTLKNKKYSRRYFRKIKAPDFRCLQKCNKRNSKFRPTTLKNKTPYVCCYVGIKRVNKKHTRKKIYSKMYCFIFKC